MPTPWLSWPRKLASTRCSATIEASVDELPPAATMRLASVNNLAWSIFMLTPFCDCEGFCGGWRRHCYRHRIWERWFEKPSAKGCLQTLHRPIGSQRRIDRLVIFLLEATDQLGCGQNLADAADALPRAP